ncbi:MAG: PAS domain-containing sensor histidine kinase [Phycisphaerae bacterium]
MSAPLPDEQIGLSDRERELGAIIRAYSEVTERLKDAHDQLNGEVAGLREELQRKNAELRRRDRLAALGEMAAGLAHEVRNPLGGIALYASMLERELARRPKALSSAKKISQGVRSLERLVSEILDFAQEDRLDRRACKLGGVLEEVLPALRPWVEESGAAVTIEDGAEAVALYCDPPRMRQVLINLLMNAVQAAGRGGEVRLGAQRETEGRNAWARIEITDNGEGIPTELLDRIFNPFFTTKASGTGLGLAIVHRIIEAHGGTIRAINRSEGGARFVLRLPPAAEAAARRAEVPVSTAGAVVH